MSTTLYVDEVTVTIMAGQTLSEPIQANGRTPLWVDTPAALSGATLAFVALDSADTERTLRDAAGQELTLTLGAAGGRHSLLPALGPALAGHTRLRIRAAAPQAALRELRIGLRNVI